MPVIQLVLSLIILGTLYSKMIKRDIPSPVSKIQAIIPIVLGVISLILSFAIFLGLGYTASVLGISVGKMQPIAGNFFSAFLGAGLPEETAKLLMILLAALIFRKKIGNVYEYILIGAAVGFGFTLFEEFLYGSEALPLFRLLGIALHMVFGIIMARHLGTAKYKKITGNGSPVPEIILAVAVPMIIHTVYDACTAMNSLIKSDDERQEAIGVIMGLAAFLCAVVLQIAILASLKKKAGKYCEMRLIKHSSGEEEPGPAKADN